MSLLNLTSFPARLIIVFSMLFFHSSAFAAGIHLASRHHQKDDNFSLLNNSTTGSPEYHWQSGIFLAGISGGEYARVARSAEPEKGAAGSGVSEESGDKAIDFGKIADGLSGGEPSEGYLYWYIRPGDDSGMTRKARLWRYKKQEVLADQTKYLALISLIGAGVLYLMPESVTQWDKDSMTFSTLADKWGDNVRAAPVWDKDDLWLNYIAHPYFGSAYYIMARHSGFDWKGAFLFSTFVSTFLWEGGVESFGEIPSAQDLIITPVAGALLGEMLLHGEERIIQNGGTLLGSRALGQISLVLIDPAGHAISALKRVSDWPSRINAHTEFFYEPLSVYGSGSPMNQLSDPDGRYGVRLVFTYN